MAQSTIAYLCECGKKWIFPRKEGQGPSKVKCSCGRTILLRDGVVYSTAK